MYYENYELSDSRFPTGCCNQHYNVIYRKPSDKAHLYLPTPFDYSKHPIAQCSIETGLVPFHRILQLFTMLLHCIIDLHLKTVHCFALLDGRKQGKAGWQACA